jgi:hypothetical protein
MTSVYAPYANAIIEMNLEQGYVTDGYNDIPNIVKYQLKAHLKQEKTPTAFQLGGVDQYLTNYTGYLIDRPPDNFVRPQEVNVTFTDIGTSKFIIVRTMPSPFYNEVETLGTAIALLSKVG